MQTGCTWYMPLLTMWVTLGFFLATLEEYYCGKLDLGIINGVSDACIAVYIVGGLSAVYGCGVWQPKTFIGISLYESIFYTALIMVIITAFFKYFRPFTASYKKIFNAGGKVKEVLINSSMYVIINATFYVHYRMNSLGEWYVRPLFITYGLMICKLLLHMMIAHMTKQKLQPFRVSILLNCASVFLWLLTPLRFVVPEKCLYWFTFCLSVLCSFVW